MNEHDQKTLTALVFAGGFFCFMGTMIGAAMYSTEKGSELPESLPVEVREYLARTAGILSDDFQTTDFESPMRIIVAPPTAAHVTMVSNRKTRTLGGGYDINGVELEIDGKRIEVTEEQRGDSSDRGYASSAQDKEVYPAIVFDPQKYIDNFSERIHESILVIARVDMSSHNRTGGLTFSSSANWVEWKSKIFVVTPAEYAAARSYNLKEAGIDPRIHI
ncbi:hypothetical protein GC176_08645 [bacterium]|nr:hypothetical protein [bacterium]